MTITTQSLNNKLQIRSNYGVVDGKEKIKSKTYASLKSSAANADVYAVAEGLSDLQIPTLEEVIKVENTLLISTP